MLSITVRSSVWPMMPFSRFGACANGSPTRSSKALRIPRRSADSGRRSDQWIHPSVLRATHPLPQAVELVEQAVLGLAPEMLELLPQIAYPLAHVSGDLASTRRALGRQELTSGSLDQVVQLLRHLGQHVFAGDDSEELSLADHRHPPDPVRRHPFDDAFEGLLGSDGLERLAHHLCGGCRCSVLASCDNALEEVAVGHDPH